MRPEAKISNEMIHIFQGHMQTWSRENGPGSRGGRELNGMDVILHLSFASIRDSTSQILIGFGLQKSHFIGRKIVPILSTIRSHGLTIHSFLDCWHSKPCCSDGRLLYYDKKFHFMDLFLEDDQMVWKCSSCSCFTVNFFRTREGR
jgi:hypothetical protein